MTEEPQKSPEELIEEMEEAQHPISKADVNEAFAVQSSQGNKTVPIVAIIAGAIVLLGYNVLNWRIWIKSFADQPVQNYVAAVFSPTGCFILFFTTSILNR